MSATAPTRLCHRRTPSSDRFLDVFSLPGPSSPDAGEELHEEELFWIGGFADSPGAASTHTPLSRRNGAQGTSGILAALPESGPSTRSGANRRPVVNQKASSSRMIPAIPKPAAVERHLQLAAKYHQSAPMDVPALSKAVRMVDEFNDDECDDEADGEMLPPHEIVARGSEDSPVLSRSVLEGVGRTLKGRDLSQVRNAVWRQTGFLD